jgi:hypothetical protein
MLGERIDQSTNFKRTAEVDETTLGEYIAGKSQSKEEKEAISNYLYGRFLRLFLEARETLTIPDDALHRLASELQKDTNDLHLTFRYEEFYADQLLTNWMT